MNYQPTDGNLRINIDRQCEDDDSSSTANNNTVKPYTLHVRPPQGISTLCLDRIDLTIAIFETRNRAVARKRQKREVTRQATNLNGDEDSTIHLSSFSEDTCRPGPGPPWCPKNDQPQAMINVRGPPTTTSGVENLEKRNHSSIDSVHPTLPIADGMSFEIAQLASLTDAVIRFSISLNTKGSNFISRVKANTFIYGLADIAPALWRTRDISVCRILYMLVLATADLPQALPHAVNSNPIIARSLDRISVSARSSILKAKIRALIEDSSENDPRQDLASHELVQNTVSAITDRLWVHVQKSQISRPMVGPIQAFCVPSSNVTIAEDSSDILEEHEALRSFRYEHMDTRLEPTHAELSKRHCSSLFNGSESILELPITHHDVEESPLLNETGHSQHSVNWMASSYTRDGGVSKDSNDNTTAQEHAMLFNYNEAIECIGMINDQKLHSLASPHVECNREVSCPLTDDESLLFRF